MTENMPSLVDASNVNTDSISILSEPKIAMNEVQTLAYDSVPSSPSSNKLQEKLLQIEAEAAKIRELQSQFFGKKEPRPLPLTDAEKAEVDARSIYVGNVEYAATNEGLEQHFLGCGPIERVTIKKDRFSGHPKGFAYIQFADVDSMQNALALNDTLFLGRQITVTMKRTNKPGISTTDRAPRGRGRGGAFRGYSGRGGARGFPAQNRFNRGFGGFRGKRGGRGGFAPY